MVDRYSTEQTQFWAWPQLCNELKCVGTLVVGKEIILHTSQKCKLRIWVYTLSKTGSCSP